MKAGLPLLALFTVVLTGCGGDGSSPSAGGGGGGSIAPSLRYTAFTDSGLPTDLSGDGSTVVGYTQLGSAINPVAWKYPDYVLASFSSEISSSAYLAAVTPDGSHFLGVWHAGILVGQPALLTPTGTVTVLALPAGKTDGYPIDLSDDGKVVLCLDAPPTTPFHPRPYLVKNGVVTYLPLPDGVTTAYASAISGDGHVVVGTINDQAAIWVNGGAPELIAAPQSGARDVSRDGNVVVGIQRDSSSLGSHPFRWTAAGGTEDLPVSPDYPKSAVASGVSEDGNTVLISGNAVSGSEGIPQLWRNGSGTQTVADLITAAGGDGAGFMGASPIKLSADGHSIIGRGQRGTFSSLAGSWVLTLP